jgi:hypothetical protein
MTANRDRCRLADPSPGVGAMTSLLFLLFLVTMILAMSDKEKMSFVVYGIAIVVSVVWFSHHISEPLAIQL